MFKYLRTYGVEEGCTILLLREGLEEILSHGLDLWPS